MLIQTIKGLIELDRLEITDIVTWGENHRTIATEWRLDGEIVKRDVHVAILRGLEMGSGQGQLG